MKSRGLSRFKNYIKKYVILAGCKGILNFIPDKFYLKIIYYLIFGKKLNINNPETFNEKLQWLKINDQNPEYIQKVDKYEVRNYIKKVLGEKYLIPLIGVYNNFDEINLEKLPEKFVLKCTHDSGGVIICTDKSTLDIEKVKIKLNKSLKKNYYYPWREWPYKNIKPRIICEKYMIDKSTNELRDYKFMCFNGKAKCLFVGLNRNSTNGLNVDFYDLDWNIMPFERHYKKSGLKIPKPKNLNKMIEFAELLSNNIPFVRVDFYEINGDLYFGELTFYPGAGLEEFTPEKYDKILGSWIKLPL